MTLEAGVTAPEVSLQNQDGDVIDVDLDGPVVLYFYPRDHTSGCTTEARQFELERSTYEEAGVAIYGISTDDVETHASFCEAEELGFDLLADTDASVAEAYEVPMRSNQTMRTTFVVIDGEINRVYQRVNPDGHAREVLMDLLDAGIVELEG